MSLSKFTTRIIRSVPGFTMKSRSRRPNGAPTISARIGRRNSSAYFERVIKASGGPYLTGKRVTYADLSLFQVVAGLDYAFPRMMKRLARKCPHVRGLHDRVAARPRVAAYLKSERRIPFNEMGIFRFYATNWTARRQAADVGRAPSLTRQGRFNIVSR